MRIVKKGDVARWKDGSKDCVDIQIEDPNITINSLHITLGSFYRVRQGHM